MYPNFRAVSRYALLAAANRAGELGVRRRPRRGEGLEFHQLREYRQGDSLRQIDWKATARLRRAISREYEDERDQQIVFLLDCGRRMHARDDALSHFDHALDAVLLLAHVALRQGDAVGLLTLQRRSALARAAQGRASSSTRVLNSVYDLQSERARLRLPGRARSSSRPGSPSARSWSWSPTCATRTTRSCSWPRACSAAATWCFVASMKERALSAALETRVRDLDSALTVAATHQYLLARRRAHERLRKSGVLALDAEPHELAVALVNGYLDVKASGVL